jgi:predicted NBD/HSP70 family sugar kinase
VKRHLVAVDIGGSKISFLARETPSGRDVHADKIKTPTDAGVEGILRLLDEQIDGIPGGRASMVALGVAVPGHVDSEGHVLNAGNLEGWVNVPLRTLLEDRYGVPVFVERDANCGAIGEKWAGAAMEMKDFVFLALGTGVGAGLFLEGHVYRGAHDAAGEAGDMSFPARGETPTVSDVVGKRAIKRSAKRVTGEKMSAAEALAKSTRLPRLERATRKVVEYLSTSVVAIAALLDPEAIIFGGGTSNAGKPLLDRVREQIAPHPLFRARLLLANLGSDSQLYGALWGAAKVADLLPAESLRLRSRRKRAAPRTNDRAVREPHRAAVRKRRPGVEAASALKRRRSGR